MALAAVNTEAEALPKRPFDAARLKPALTRNKQLIGTTEGRALTHILPNSAFFSGLSSRARAHVLPKKVSFSAFYPLFIPLELNCATCVPGRK